MKAFILRLGERVAPFHFLLFGFLLLAGGVIALVFGAESRIALLLGFDLGVIGFLSTVIPFLKEDVSQMRLTAEHNDANCLVVLTLCVLLSLIILAALALCGVFQLAGWNFFFHFMKRPPPPAGSPGALFMQAVGPTGYLKFVIILEILGGFLVLAPATRALDLLILGPIAINILCYHGFQLKGSGLFPCHSSSRSAPPSSCGRSGRRSCISSRFLQGMNRACYSTGNFDRHLA